MNDLDYLKKASEEGNKQAEPYNFGAALVIDDEVIASGHESVFEDFDPSAHAEVNVIRMAGAKLQQYPLLNATLYASHQPCTMCLMCAVWAGVKRVVYAIPAKNSGSEMYELKTDQLSAVISMLEDTIEIKHVPLKGSDS